MGKPILLDFNGYQCVNSRKMEDFVWVQPEVYRLLMDNFIIVSLYVDDKKALPENQLGATSITGKEIKTYGDKWYAMEIERYSNVTQPIYGILDHVGNDLVDIASYQTHNDPEIFAAWLREGLEKFKSR